uniref:Uncharacterized protein isoform X3 n=2 Tax=Nicotiana TaxID=4085 RepID=A0A1S3ZN68_TOBAC|nr:PREDICTED: uncharacterized protein LOC104230638 isoform X1 [Nicotiana sylvestris]XP_016465708.1 PREDICTED: uncharacterized protein LOC107788542 isoform X3 [Nicotiana tabacum]
MWDGRIWKGEVCCTGAHTITCKFSSKIQEYTWHLSAMYAPNDRRKREEVWWELAGARGLFNGPWVVCEDFNAVRYPSEKKNCSRITRAMMEFSSFIEDMELVDLQLAGGDYTWRKGDKHVIAARLDRFLISVEWNENFRNIKQQLMLRVTSDHSPLMLQCGSWEPVKSYFKFENWWLQTEGFKDRVEDCWKSFICEGRPDYILAFKLKALKAKLKEWSKTMQGNLALRKASVLNQQPVKSYFKFENWWLQTEGFKDRVEDCWKSFICEGRPDYILAFKLKALKAKLKEWSKTMQGNLALRKASVLNQQPVKSYFKFENWWLQTEGFKDRVEDCWKSFICEGRPDYILAFKLKALKAKLKEWSKTMQGNLALRKASVLNQLAELEEVHEQMSLTEEEIYTKTSLSMEFEEIQEEIAWRQRSRALWLKEGDRNTKYFHRTANAHKRYNNIDQLTVEGETLQCPEDIKREIIRFYKKLYTEEED